MRPPAIRAGRIGTKISAIVLMKRETGLPPLAATSLASSLETSLTPPVVIISEKTVSTSPGPTMIWNMPPAMKVPLRSGSLSRAFWSTLSMSLRTRRNLVAQCAAALMFSAPPTYVRTSFATRA